MRLPALFLFFSRDSPLLLAPTWRRSARRNRSSRGPGLLVKTYAAFDDVNQVYLVVWGTQEPRPALGIILNTAGEPVTQPFAISDPHGAAGYVRVSAGGGRFLVTYTKTISEDDDIYHHMRGS